MKQDDISWVRKTYKIPDKITDERISEVFKLLSSGGFFISLRERVGNELEKELLLTEVFSEFHSRSVILENQYEIRLQRTCEELFVMGYYDASCVMSRAFAEYLLQNTCLELLSAEGPDKERKIIDWIKNKGSNPPIKEMKDALGSRLTDEEKCEIDMIVHNGNWVVHHQYGKMTDGKMADKYSRKMPLFRINKQTKRLDIIPDHERSTLEWNRPWEERRMALESLRALYRLIYRRRAIDSEEAKAILINDHQDK